MVGLLLFIVFSFWGLDSILKPGFSELMRQPIHRFFDIEHGVVMVFDFVVVHLGNALSKKALDSKGKFIRTAIFSALQRFLPFLGLPGIVRYCHGFD
jgi:hypothetical protein